MAKRKITHLTSQKITLLAIITSFLLAFLYTFFRNHPQPIVLGTNQLDLSHTCSLTCCQSITLTSTEPDCTDQSLVRECDRFGGTIDDANCQSQDPTPLPSNYPRSLSSLKILSIGMRPATVGQEYETPVFINIEVSPPTTNETILRDLYNNLTATLIPTSALPPGMMLRCSPLSGYSQVNTNHLRHCSIFGTPKVSGQ